MQIDATITINPFYTTKTKKEETKTSFSFPNCLSLHLFAFLSIVSFLRLTMIVNKEELGEVDKKIYDNISTEDPSLLPYAMTIIRRHNYFLV